MHVYALDVDAFAGRLDELALTLDLRDQRDAARLTEPRRRQWLAVARAALRQVLGAHVGAAPQAVPINRDAEGRPRLGCATGLPDLRFSSARSGPYAAIALSSGHDIGIDIEAVAGARFDADLAALMLSKREQAIHERLDPALRARWLASAWTAKEAILKGMGCGLRVPPHLVDVAARVPAPTQPHPMGTGFATWRAATVPDAWCVATAQWRGCAIAIAERGRRPRLRCAQLLPLTLVPARASVDT